MDTPETFSYERPETVDRPKVIEHFSRSAITTAHVQIVRDDGANNLHGHNATEGFWMVLEGTARFYTENDEVIGTFDRYEGVHIPMEYPYWFESVGDDHLEILHVSARAETREQRRIDYETEWDDAEDLPAQYRDILAAIEDTPRTAGEVADDVAASSETIAHRLERLENEGFVATADGDRYTTT